jgi:hypothetical protein
VPADWKIIQDAKATCQIAVPPEWVPFGENNGAAVFHDSATAIAVVTSQRGQEFKPLSLGLVKTIGIPKEKMFENSARRIFYQDKTSRRPEPVLLVNLVSAGICLCNVPRNLSGTWWRRLLFHAATTRRWDPGWQG